MNFSRNIVKGEKNFPSIIGIKTQVRNGLKKTSVSFSRLSTLIPVSEKPYSYDQIIEAFVIFRAPYSRVK